MGGGPAGATASSRSSCWDAVFAGLSLTTYEGDSAGRTGLVGDTGETGGGVLVPVTVAAPESTELAFLGALLPPNRVSPPVAA